MKKIFYVWSDKFIKKLSENRKEKVEKIDREDEIASDIIILNLITSDNIRDIIKFSEASEEKWANFLGCSPKIAEIFMDKWKTKKILSEKNISVSKWEEVIWNYFEMIKIIEKNNFNFPILLKEVDNVAWQWIFVLKNLEDLKKLEIKSEQNYVLEEFIEWIEYSWMLFSYNWKKIIFPPVYKWKTWFDEKWNIIHALQKLRTTDINEKANEKIREIIERIWDLDWVNWFIDIDFVYDEKNDDFKILEINPRTSWVTDMVFSSSDFSMDDLIDFLTWDSKIVWDVCLLKNKIIVEYPIVFENSDFEAVELELFWWKILKNDFLRKFPPYTQKMLLEFENKEDYEKFISNYKK